MYQYQYSYTHQDLVALNRAARKAYRRGSLFFRLAGGVIGASSLFMGILMIKETGPVGLPNVLLGVLLVGSALWYDHINARFSRRMLMRGTGEYTMTVEAEGLWEKSLKGESFYPYGSMIGVIRCRECYLFFLDKKHAAILPERVVPAEERAAVEGYLKENVNEIKEIK